jgi:hypothetical protein
MKLRSGSRFGSRVDVVVDDSDSDESEDTAMEDENYTNELKEIQGMPKIPEKMDPGDQQSFRHLSNRSVLMITHFNVFLYALFFWIQNGIMPVSDGNIDTTSY